MKYLRTSSTPHLAQHLYGLRHHAQRLPRPREFPARDGDESVRLQVVEVLAESLYGVKVVLAEGKGPSRGGGPGVDQCHLDDVVSVPATANRRASVADANMDLGQVIKVGGGIGVPLAHDGGGDGGVNCNCGDIRAPAGQRAQYVDAAARANDRVVATRAKHAGDPAIGTRTGCGPLFQVRS